MQQEQEEQSRSLQERVVTEDRGQPVLPEQQGQREGTQELYYSKQALLALGDREELLLQHLVRVLMEVTEEREAFH